MIEELIRDRDDLWLAVEKRSKGKSLEVTFRVKSPNSYLLHWGFASSEQGPWLLPPQTLWPAKTKTSGKMAVQTPFTTANGENQLSFVLESSVPAPYLIFDLYCPETNRWENNRGRDFYLPLNEIKLPAPNPDEVLRIELESNEVVTQKDARFDSGEKLAMGVSRDGDQFRVILLTDAAGPINLRWGLAGRARSKWRIPPEPLQPDGTIECDAVAVETPFAESDGLRRLEMAFGNADAPRGIAFVLHQTECDRWLKVHGRDMYLPITQNKQDAGALPPLAEAIVEPEMNHNSWTLMHRFNLCHDLIDEAGDDRGNWAILFVWLRYSSLRQLDWQRNYNTKPRELSHSQDRLCRRLAESYVSVSANRDLVRLMFSCLGRGGDGQQIRDEILQIMHRHHIKEMGGTWMEQWHQKLHNNTTPDDVVICEAYLAFLESQGDVNRYYQTLEAGGVTMERLASLERPITMAPEWHPHMRDALLHDFWNYLKLLRSVHSGTDFETAVNTASYLLDEGTRDSVHFALHNFGNTDISATELGWKITEARRNLAEVLARDRDAGKLKDAIYLDIGLEEALRTLIERRLHPELNPDSLVELIDLTVENLLFIEEDAELRQCHREWQRLPGDHRDSKDWALHAKATIDRLRRATEQSIDRFYRLLQPKAEALGQAFEAEEWTVKTFSEGVVRGRLVFALSMLLHHFDPVLRHRANLGDWQVISPGTALGRVKVMKRLQEAQGTKFSEPTVLVADEVRGEEEPPEGANAIVTPSSVDLVSHLAVRARNAGLLFATCFDPDTFGRLQRLEAKTVEIRTNPTGEVEFDESSKITRSAGVKSPTVSADIKRPNPVLRVLRMDQFESALVGGKSRNLMRLRKELPGEIHTPRSIALPFGVFEAVMEDKRNAQVARRCDELVSQLDDHPEMLLRELRTTILGLQLPDSLLQDLNRTAEQEGFAWPQQDERIAERIKQVWASKWNDRAFFSRRTRKWPHDAVSMAVLIQEVIDADYAFVIHTANPFSGNRAELYAEVVLGLGETLVGNYPGRAFSFTSARDGTKQIVLAYPSKNVSLRGSGLIFRSDSNAEDLEGYAGAGLYDSVLLEPADEVRADYTDEPLVWDEAERDRIMKRIADAGLAVERTFGSPQDVEGAISGDRIYVVQARPQVGLKDDSVN